MKIDVLMDEEDIVIYPICKVEGCGREVRSVTYDSPLLPVTAIDVHTVMTFDMIANPCGHVQPRDARLVWVTRDGEPDCGM